MERIEGTQGGAQIRAAPGENGGDRPVKQSGKRKWIVAGVAALAVVLVGAWAVLRPSKAAAVRYVQGHQAELTAYVKTLLAIDPAQLEDYHGYSGGDTYDGWDVTCYPHTGMVEFQTSVFGLVPSSTYSGFYYSPEDVPLGFQSTQVDFVESGGGWLWEEPEGDNRQYTEKIADHWYWYEASF